MTTTSPSMGEQLHEIGCRMDEATAAWAAAGYPGDGPLVDARKAVFADLRDWTRRMEERS